jgi:tRNA threonylcarbamoyladenosine biosynthesis protein TsaB
MRLLALDSATEHCSVALLSQGRLLERDAGSGKAHAEQLLGMVSGLLTEAQIALSDLDAIAASIGPGSFTGVRISVAVAQGLAFGCGARVIAVSTLEALAMRAIEECTPHAEPASHAEPMRDSSTRALACLDARMQEVYWGCYAADPLQGVIAVTAPRVSAPGAVALPPGRYLGIGRGFAAYPALQSLARVQLLPGAEAAPPRAREFARLGALRLRLGQTLDPAELQPLYLRDKVAQTEAERAAR